MPWKSFIKSSWFN